MPLECTHYRYVELLPRICFKGFYRYAFVSMSRMKSLKYFKIGCYVLVFIACAHLVGHFLPVNASNETESQLLFLMNSYPKKILGGKMTMMDIQKGLSLCYSLFFLSSGTLNLYLIRKKLINESSLKPIALINTITFGIGTVISLIYFFWLPVISFLIATFFFSMSVIQKNLKNS
jgi:hypothetical protein